MSEISKEEIKDIIKEAISDCMSTHVCQLTDDQIKDMALISSFLTKFRNALGNIVLLIIALSLVVGLSGLVYFATLGKINPFKFFGG